MVNRRYLRIKVYQALYAFWQSDGGSAAKVEKELLLSIERTFDLYMQLMLLFGELRRVGANRIEERRNKRLPTAEDLNPNMRFVENPLLVRIAESQHLMAESNKRRLGWMGEHEFLSKLSKQIETGNAYKTYMELPSTTFKQDQALVLDIFLEHIVEHEPLHDICEAKSIYWLEDLDLALTMVKRTIEAMQADDTDLPLTDLVRDPEEEEQFVTTLYRRTIEQGPEHERSIAERASNWEAERIALSDMILMKMALTEARVFDQIPLKVTMNEYIEIAKAYSTPKSKGFINGILDKLFAGLKDAGEIRKVGRGLLES